MHGPHSAVRIRILYLCLYIHIGQAKRPHTRRLPQGRTGDAILLVSLLLLSMHIGGVGGCRGVSADTPADRAYEGEGLT